MQNEVVQFEIVDGIATLKVTREKSLNALNAEVMKRLAACVRELEGDTEARGLIVTGSGDRAFVAGADIGELKQIPNASAGRRMVERGQGILRALERLRIPVIACVNGYALGGGLELALACHMRYGVRSAQLGLPEVGLGVIPGYGGTQRLARVIGRGRATEMIVTGQFVDAEQAHAMGLVDRLFDDTEAMLEAAQKTIKAAAKVGPLATRAALEAIDRGLDQPIDAALQVEADLFAMLCETDDMREGLAAFLEKRKASFKGS
jgi:enoyl-CoA hydratase